MNKKILVTMTLIILVKAFLASKAIAPFKLPEEACYSLQAQNFIHNLALAKCSSLFANISSSWNFPIYYILISPFYALFSQGIAYKLALTINSIISASILFPLSKIAYKHLKKSNLSLVIATIITLGSIVSLAEKTLLPNSILLTTGIWSFYFYHNDQIKSAFITSLIATFAHPLGIILNITISLSEIIKNKNIKKTNIMFAITILLSMIYLTKMNSNSINNIDYFLNDIEYHPNFFSQITTALKQSLNVLSLSTIFILAPLGLIALKNKELKQYKNFTIVLLILSIIFSTYISYSGISLGISDISTISLILSFLGIISLIKTPKFIINKLNLSIVALFLIPLIFIKLEETHLHFSNIYSSTYLAACFLISITALVIKDRVKLKISLVLTIILTTSIFSNYHILNSTQDLSKTSQFFLNKNHKILFLIDESANNNQMNENYWLLTSQSDNEIAIQSIKVPYNPKGTTNIPDQYLETIRNKNYDYIVSTLDITNFDKVLSNEKEFIYSSAL